MSLQKAREFLTQKNIWKNTIYICFVRNKKCENFTKETNSHKVFITAAIRELQVSAGLDLGPARRVVRRAIRRGSLTIRIKPSIDESGFVVLQAAKVDIGQAEDLGQVRARPVGYVGREVRGLLGRLEIRKQHDGRASREENEHVEDAVQDRRVYAYPQVTQRSVQNPKSNGGQGHAHRSLAQCFHLLIQTP